MGLLVYGEVGFSLRNLWVFRYDALLVVCSGSDRRGVGRRGMQGRDGRALWKGKAEHREADIVKVKGCLLLRFFFLFYVFFLNIVLTWKFVGASKVSVLYIYIDYSMHFKISDIFNLSPSSSSSPPPKFSNSAIKKLV